MVIRGIARGDYLVCAYDFRNLGIGIRLSHGENVRREGGRIQLTFILWQLGIDDEMLALMHAAD